MKIPVIYLAIAISIIILIAKGLKIVPIDHRLIVYRSGKLRNKIYGPGVVLLNWITDTAIMIDLRISIMDLEEQKIVTKDLKNFKLSASVNFHVSDPLKIVSHEYYLSSLRNVAIKTFRSVSEQADSQEVLSKREELASRMTGLMKQECNSFGVAVISSEIRLMEVA